MDRKCHFQATKCGDGQLLVNHQHSVIFGGVNKEGEVLNEK